MSELGFMAAGLVLGATVTYLALWRWPELQPPKSTTPIGVRLEHYVVPSDTGTVEYQGVWGGPSDTPYEDTYEPGSPFMSQDEALHYVLGERREALIEALRERES